MSRPVDWTGPECPVWEAGSWPGRLLRAGTFAVASVGMAVVAHRLAGGHAPASAVGAAAALLFGLGVLLSRRERRGWQIAVLSWGTQAVLHVGFHGRRHVDGGALRRGAAGRLGGPTVLPPWRARADPGAGLGRAVRRGPQPRALTAAGCCRRRGDLDSICADARHAPGRGRGDGLVAAARRARSVGRDPPRGRIPALDPAASGCPGRNCVGCVLGEVRALTRRGWESGCGVRAPPGSAGAVLPGVA